jgi:hypothetical protein
MIMAISIYHLYVTNVGTNTKANIIRRDTTNNMIEFKEDFQNFKCHKCCFLNNLSITRNM